METTLSPYLNFNGNCAEAMKFYQSVFGGELDMSPYGDTPGMAMTEEQKKLIIHATLKNDLFSFMACDSRPGTTGVVGDNVHLSLANKDGKKLTEYFSKLSEGGRVDLPLAKQFWGDTFGMVTDKYQIHWMVNISAS